MSGMFFRKRKNAQDLRGKGTEMMTVKELLNECSVEAVSGYVASIAECENSDALRCRTESVIEELKSTCMYPSFRDGDFRFVAVGDTEQKPRVALLRMRELKENGYDFKRTTEYVWFWGQTLGLPVDEDSVAKHGADRILGGIVYRLTYFDLKEAEIAELRQALERKTAGEEMSRREFYGKLGRAIEKAPAGVCVRA